MLPKIETLIGKKVLVEGDVGSGKTAYIHRLIAQALEMAGTGEIIVVDMAPRRRRVGRRFVGGQLKMPGKASSRLAHHSATHVFAPRLEGKNRAEIQEMAKANALELGKVVRSISVGGRSILFINDLTMFLHAGDVDLLVDAIRRAETFIGTAYRGEFLSRDRGSGIAQREKALLEKVEKSVDLVISL